MGNEERKRDRSRISESWDEHGGEPDDEVIGELVTAGGVLRRRHRPVSVGNDVHSAERARALAQREPPVDAVPVERVPARLQPPRGLADPDPRQAHAALRRAAVLQPLRLRRRRRYLDAHHLGDVGEEVAHGGRTAAAAGLRELVLGRYGEDM